MHLVEISTKSTKNMGYAQVTQSPNFFSPNIRLNKKNSFCFLRYILFMNGFSATAADDSPTTF